MNLPPAQWQELSQLYGRTDIPFFWCGRRLLLGVALDTRVLCTVARGWNDGKPAWLLHHCNVSEKELTKRVKELNEYLLKLGLDPVELNVPDAVQWDLHDLGT